MTDSALLPPTTHRHWFRVDPRNTPAWPGLARRYAHAEARKSPVVDGKVLRSADGKEMRFPVLLSPQEKEIARMVCLAFGQKVRVERGVGCAGSRRWAVGVEPGRSAGCWEAAWRRHGVMQAMCPLERGGGGAVRC